MDHPFSELPLIALAWAASHPVDTTAHNAHLPCKQKDNGAQDDPADSWHDLLDDVMP